MKSFHIAFAGVIIQLVLGVLVILGAGESLGWAGLLLALLGVLTIIYAIIGVIPALLLMFKRTKKIGAILSIVFGVLMIAIPPNMGILIGIFLIIAGVFYFIKERIK